MSLKNECTHFFCHSMGLSTYDKMVTFFIQAEANPIVGHTLVFLFEIQFAKPCDLNVF